MHWFGHSAFLVLLVHLSVYAVNADGPISKPPHPGWVQIWAPQCDPYCRKSYYANWKEFSLGPYIKCTVNLGGCKLNRCGPPNCPPWYCRRRCQPVYKTIKCSCVKGKKIKVVHYCKCLPYVWPKPRDIQASGEPQTPHEPHNPLEPQAPVDQP